MTGCREEKLRARLEPVARAEGCELVDLEVKGRGKSVVMRLYIDKKGGVTVEDCANVSRQAELVLEVEEVMTGPYTLEVSSPGLTRPLKTPADFRRATGSLASFTLKKPVDNIKSQKTLGVIEEADDICAAVKLKNGGGLVKIPYSSIAKANLEIEF